MAISAGQIGNLIGRHLKHDIGLQNYNASTGRGYAFSGDGRVGFFVDFNQTDGPKFAVSYSAALTSTEANARQTAANTFVNGTTPFVFPAMTAATPAAPIATTTSIFYKAIDFSVVDFDSTSIGSVLDRQGLGKDDFSNTAMLLETWIAGVVETASDADVSANSGIRGFLYGVTGQRVYKLWSEWTTSLTDDKNDFLMLTDPSALTTNQKSFLVDGKGGFDRIGFYFDQKAGITADFSATNAQTIRYNLQTPITLTVKNFEGMDLTDFDDNFKGSIFDNSVSAGKGTDTIDGLGSWNSNGSSTDRDWVSYVSGTAGITVNTSSVGVMKVKDYGGSIDTLTNIDAIEGTYFIDRMYGGTGNYNQIFSGQKGADIINGGGGNDRAWHTDDASGVVVNLSAQTVNTQTVALFANSIKYAGVEGFVSTVYIMKEAFENLEMPTVKSVASNRALDGWGDIDILTSIESASGSNFNDQLYGSNGSNDLFGNDGFDFIVGNGGNDYITGGRGHDSLYGGLGRDWIVVDELNWGNLNPVNGVNRAVRDLDQSGNLVVYKSVNESTTQNSDVIDGFVLGDDLIDLTAIDANTKRVGNQNFDSNIVTTWTKKAGQLKISEFTGLVDDHNSAVSNATNGYKLSGVQLEGDVNGDGVADFAIKLVGVTLTNAQTLMSDSILH